MRIYLKNAKTFLVALLIALSACATIEKKQEKFYYNYTFTVLEDAVPEVVLEDCGYIYDYPMPEVTRHQGLVDNRKAYYNKITMKMGYEKGYVHAVSHETIHYIADAGQFNKWCLEELLAYMVTHSIKQELKIRRLKLDLERNARR